MSVSYNTILLVSFHSFLARCSTEKALVRSHSAPPSFLPSALNKPEKTLRKACTQPCKQAKLSNIGIVHLSSDQ